MAKKAVTMCWRRHCTTQRALVAAYRRTLAKTEGRTRDLEVNLAIAQGGTPPVRAPRRPRAMTEADQGIAWALSYLNALARQSREAARTGRLDLVARADTLDQASRVIAEAWHRKR